MNHFVLLSCQCRLALVWCLKLQVDWIRNWAAPVFLCSSLKHLSCLLGLPLLVFELSILHSLLQVSHPPARFPPSSCAPCPRSLPLSFVPHSIPHHSHVSLTYFLVAFIALSSSTPRCIPHCYPAPSMFMFALPFLSFAHVKLRWVWWDSWDTSLCSPVGLR